nr:hypothetical protein [Tanacetum cinerariifolium]
MYSTIWDSAKVKTINEDVQIRALVDGKKLIVNEASIRCDLKLEDAKGTACLPNDTIFEELSRMRHDKITQKLTFYKAFFSPQWKFLIHTILQCLSAKTTAWNEFSSIMASTIICLANNQKFNFSKYIFDNMVKNLEAGVKFFMFLRFVQVFVNHQLGDMSHHKKIFVTLSLTKKVFANMKREGNGLSGIITPLFDIMMVQAPENIDVDENLSLIDETAQDQGRLNEEDMFRVDDLNGDEVFMDVITGENVEQDAIVAEKVVTTVEGVKGTAAATTLQISKDKLTLAQTLIEIKAAKPKARGVIVQEPSEFRTSSSSQPSQLLQAKDKEIVEERSKKTQAEVTKGSSKRARDEIEQESAKRQRLEKDDDSVELKRCLEIVPKDDDDVTIKATPLSSKSPTIVDYKIYKERKKATSKSSGQIEILKVI